MSLATVHTTGVNWEAVAAISAIVSAIVVPILTWIAKRLTGKLDAIAQHLNRQDGKLQEHGERLARMEGPVKRTERAVTNGET
jgi:hypothetical protein